MGVFKNKQSTRNRGLWERETQAINGNFYFSCVANQNSSPWLKFLDVYLHPSPVSVVFANRSRRCLWWCIREHLRAHKKVGGCMCAGARRACTRINSLHVPEIICKFGQKTKRAAYEWNIKKEVHTHTHQERESGPLSINTYTAHDTAIWVSYWVGIPPIYMY